MGLHQRRALRPERCSERDAALLAVDEARVGMDGDAVRKNRGQKIARLQFDLGHAEAGGIAAVKMRDA